MPDAPLYSEAYVAVQVWNARHACRNVWRQRCVRQNLDLAVGVHTRLLVCVCVCVCVCTAQPSASVFAKLRGGGCCCTELRQQAF